MIETKLTCSRCSTTRLTSVADVPSIADRWAHVDVLHSGASPQLCGPCFLEFADFLTNADPALLEQLSRLTSHPVEIKIGSGDARVPSGEVIQVTDRPGALGTFHATAIEIDNPADWLVYTVKIQGRQQRVPVWRGGDSLRTKIAVPDHRPGVAKDSVIELEGLPGELFTAGAGKDPFTYEACEGTTNFTVIAFYVGSNPEGGKLAFTIHGRRIGFPSSSKQAQVLAKHAEILKKTTKTIERLRDRVQ